MSDTIDGDITCKTYRTNMEYMDVDMTCRMYIDKHDLVSFTFSQTFHEDNYHVVTHDHAILIFKS